MENPAVLVYAAGCSGRLNLSYILIIVWYYPSVETCKITRSPSFPHVSEDLLKLPTEDSSSPSRQIHAAVCAGQTCVQRADMSGTELLGCFSASVFCRAARSQGEMSPHSGRNRYCSCVFVTAHRQTGATHTPEP